MHETTVRVYYADTDHGHVVYYGNYFKWFEIGRTEILREAGIDYAAFEKENLIAPVVEAHCDYQKPATYNDKIVIRTSVTKLGTSSITFSYELYKKAQPEIEIAKGYTVNVFVDMKTMKSAPMPEQVRKALEPHLVES